MTSLHVICGLASPNQKPLVRLGNRLKNFFLKIFFFWRTLAAVSLIGPWPWPRAFLFLASRGSVLEKAVLGPGFFLCPWPWSWPRVLCPRLHL